MEQAISIDIQPDTLELVKRAQGGCEASKSMLIEQNSPLVKSIVKRFLNRGVEYSDLFQLGCIGFLKAITNFDAKYEVKFSTYAVPLITGEIKRFLRDDGIIKISRKAKSLASKIAYYIEEYKKANIKSPTINQIAEHLQVDPQEVVFALEATQKTVSVYEQIDEGDNSRLLLDMLHVHDTSDDLLDIFALKEVIKKMGERERKVILLRFFRDKTQSEIAAILGVSQVQVSRIETKVLEVLRKELTAGIS